jgi:hypothetical protein
LSAPIIAVQGMETGREGETPTFYGIGSECWGVGGIKFTPTKIERREEQFGDHGLLWFDVYAGDRLAVSMLGRAVGEVHYALDDEA